MPVSHQCSKGPAHRDTSVVHSRTNHKDHNLACSLTQGANLALTLTKLVLRTMNLISMLLDGLEVFLDVCVVSWDSSKLKMAGVRHIYRSLTQGSRY